MLSQSDHQDIQDIADGFDRREPVYVREDGNIVSADKANKRRAGQSETTQMTQLKPNTWY